MAQKMIFLWSHMALEASIFHNVTRAAGRPKMLYNLKVHKGNYPMTNNTDELLSFELYSEDELKELQQQSEDQDFTDSIPTFSELNPSLS